MNTQVKWKTLQESSQVASGGCSWRFPLPHPPTPCPIPWEHLLWWGLTRKKKQSRLQPKPDVGMQDGMGPQGPWSPSGHLQGSRFGKTRSKTPAGKGQHGLLTASSSTQMTKVSLFCQEQPCSSWMGGGRAKGTLGRTFSEAVVMAKDPEVFA